MGNDDIAQWHDDNGVKNNEQIDIYAKQKVICLCINNNCVGHTGIRPNDKIHGRR